jgi:hypothetical protein
MCKLNTAARRGVLAAVLLMALLPASASANWGRKTNNGASCGPFEGEHCYAIDEWNMTGAEKVEGTLAYQYTTAMNVPGWASGDFVTNEEWALFEPYFHWVEAGQIAGASMDCCGLHEFYAYDNSSGFWKVTAPWTVPAWTNNLYQLVAAGSGTWCVDWATTQVACSSGFPTYSNRLLVGDEIAAATKPENAGKEGTNATWVDGSVHNWNKAQPYADGGMCLSQNTSPYPAPGNINFGTC